MPRRAVPLLLLALLSCQNRPESYDRWAKIELAFQGPASESLGARNPFGIHLDVTFRSPDGRRFAVPGFYAGDGHLSPDGDVWKVRFSADQNGQWTYQTDSDEPLLDSREGSFEVGDPPADAPEFYRVGRLEYTGRPYLKFREGGYWLKAGADEPENILGRAFGDWEDKRRQIDYLASRGINSLYVMTHTLDGDGNDVWPWIGTDPEQAKGFPDRFDVIRLERWRDFFEYLQEKGIVLYMILEDDSAWTGYDREAYYREMVARFGDLPALYFNAGEEANENYSLDESIEHMKLLASIDPYNHPRAIHNVRTPLPDYIDTPELDLSSIQTWPTSPEKLNQLAIAWHRACLVRGKRRLVVNFDEARPAADRRSPWSVFLGGGVWEPIVPVPDTYAALEPLWSELSAAKRFMESLPFEKMYPANHLVTEGKAFCFAKPGEVYALYFLSGGSARLAVPDSEYQIEWFDPRLGKFLADRRRASGSSLLLATPTGEDWAVRIRPTDGPVFAPPTAVSARVYSLGGERVEVTLALWDSDAPKAYDVEIVSPPPNGTLRGQGARRAYRPKPGFHGEDRFRWRASGDGWRSNIATISIYASRSRENERPTASNQPVRTRAGQPVLISLRYSDPDGPGPYFWQIRRAPEHGTVTGADNDVVYTPEEGFTGRDSFTWVVNDGLGRSKPATVTITVR